MKLSLRNLKYLSDTGNEASDPKSAVEKKMFTKKALGERLGSCRVEEGDREITLECDIVPI